MNHDNLEQRFTEVWQRLEKASDNPEDPFRTTCLATVDPSGAPQSRMVILRDADATNRRVSIYSDGAALKCLAIGTEPKAAFCFWDAQSRTQVRLVGTATLVKGGAVQPEWDSQRPHERDLYRIAPKPGTVIPHANAYAYENGSRFTRIDCTVQSVDILCLGRPNHTRLHGEWSQDQWLLNWVTP